MIGDDYQMLYDLERCAHRYQAAEDRESRPRPRPLPAKNLHRTRATEKAGAGT